jgi:hypothetical protein
MIKLYNLIVHLIWQELNADIVFESHTLQCVGPTR